jgi:hypothetical protein
LTRRRPILAFGDSDRDFKLSPLVEALDQAVEYGITVVSMKRDGKTMCGQ